MTFVLSFSLKICPPYTPDATFPFILKFPTTFSLRVGCKISTIGAIPALITPNIPPILSESLSVVLLFGNIL